MSEKSIDKKSRTSPLQIHDNLRLEIEYVEPAKLYLPDRRLRKHSERQITGIMASMSAFGCVAPLVVDSSYMVIDGEAVLEAARRLNMTLVPVVRVEHLSQAQTRKLGLALKKLATYSDWNTKELRLELIELMDIEDEVSIQVTGFDLAEIDEIISEPEEEAPEAGSLPEPIEPGQAISRLGDLWHLGQHRLLCGSSLEPTNLERLLAGEQVRMVLEDMPYNVKIQNNVSGRGKVKHREFVEGSSEKSDAEFAQFMIDSLGAHAEVCADGALIYEFIDWRHGGEMYAACAANELTLINVVAWVKSAGANGSLYRSQHELVFIAKKGTAPHCNNVQMGKYGRYRTNCWHYPGMNSFGKNRDELLAMHPTVKNLTMFADAIRDVTNRGDIVLDGFAGSGTTIIAAEKTGRIARCVELDPLYADCIIRRWEKFSGVPARLDGPDGPTFAEVEEARAEGESDELFDTPLGTEVSDRDTLPRTPGAPLHSTDGAEF